MSEALTLPKGCAWVIVPPVLIAFSGLGTLWEAFVLHKIWVWHLSSFFEPKPVSTIFAVLLAVWVVRRTPPTQKQTDTRTEKEKLTDVALTLLFPILTPALALLFAWWAT